MPLASACLISCGHCGGAVTAELKKQKYVYYHCATRCQREKFVREEKLAQMLHEHLLLSNCSLADGELTAEWRKPFRCLACRRAAPTVKNPSDQQIEGVLLDGRGGRI